MPSSIRTVRPVGLPSSSTLSEPAAVGDRAVVDDGDAGRGHALADAAREGREALAVEVALEAVADRLVEQDPRPARREHDRHRPGGRLDGAESSVIAVRAASRAKCSGGFSPKNSGPSRPPPPAEPSRRTPFSRRDHVHPDREERLHVLDEDAGRVRDPHAARLLAEARDHLLDARVVRARGAVGALDERDALGERAGRRRSSRRSGGGRARATPAAAAAVRESDAMWAAVSAARAIAGQRQVVGVGVAGALARDDADAEPAGHPGRGGADDPFLEEQRRRRLVLEVEVGEGSAPREGEREEPLHLGDGDVVGGTGAVVRGHCDHRSRPPPDGRRPRRPAGGGGGGPTSSRRPSPRLPAAGSRQRATAPRRSRG